MRFIAKFAAAAWISLSVVLVQGQVSSPPSEDVAAGKALFEGAGGCVKCHSVDDRGGTLGPDLSWVGLLRTQESLRRALVDPNAQISRRYATVVAEPANGQVIEGIRLNEDDYSIQIRDTQGELRSFIKSELKSLRRDPRSLMPSYAAKLSDVEIDRVVGYLRTLRKLWSLAPEERTREIAPATENVPFFDRPERDTEERPELLMQALRIPAGAAVADIGSGTGYFTWRLAQQVGPSGKVYAVDIQQTMLDLTKSAVDRHKLTNVEYVLATETEPRLPAQSVDLAFLAYAFHEFADPETTMAAIRRALKPGGRVLVLEYAKESNIAPASPLHKMSFEEIRREIEPTGFVVDQLLDFLPVQHGVIFTIK
jgi:putative heme-binding domain-containing protein